MMIRRASGRIALAVTVVTFCVTPSLYATHYPLPAQLLCIVGVILAASFGGFPGGFTAAGAFAAIDAVSATSVVAFASTNSVEQLRFGASLWTAAVLTAAFGQLLAWKSRRRDAAVRAEIVAAAQGEANALHDAALQAAIAESDRQLAAEVERAHEEAGVLLEQIVRDTTSAAEREASERLKAYRKSLAARLGATREKLRIASRKQLERFASELDAGVAAAVRELEDDAASRILAGRQEVNARLAAEEQDRIEEQIAAYRSEAEVRRTEEFARIDRETEELLQADRATLLDTVSRRIADEISALEMEALSVIEREIEDFRQQRNEHRRLTEEEIQAGMRRRIATAAAEAEDKASAEIFRYMAELERRTASERDDLMQAAQREVAAAREEVRDATRELLDFERTQLEEIAAAKEAFIARMVQERALLESESLAVVEAARTEMEDASRRSIESKEARLIEWVAEEKIRLVEAIAAEMEHELERGRVEMRADVDHQLEEEKRELRRATVDVMKREREQMQIMIRRFSAERLQIARAIGVENRAAVDELDRRVEPEKLV
jgi:hypothetical protein